MELPQVLYSRVSSLHYGQVIAYLTLECLLYVSHNSLPFFRNDLPGKEDRGEEAAEPGKGRTQKDARR